MSSELKPLEYWNKFKSAFCEALDSADVDAFIQAWTSGPERTVFYERILMPSVAERFGTHLQTEKFRCDYAFLSEQGVPLVFAESENAHPRAYHEIDCLCSLASPVKALFLSCEWQDSEKEKFLPSWIEIIRKHHSVVLLDCLYAIIVGEWTQREKTYIRYSFDLVFPDGTVEEDGFHGTKVLPV